ncbi:ABC transporter permease [Planctomyces sp. SH-PL62]|uniref:ABC transporter permease n=1 Tax=Planctomyces sp. SH-PL62 TaxID=1636152 RepID=UPI00078C087C|nr:ABC transporter permease subunit [Planctomyces sp. SH-PL62]AMV37876.1 ABC-2 family transporter protein [Planctomyces sp. SH-PL62]
MARRVGLGPVFAYEWRMASRRWPGYAMRSLTVLLMLGVMTPVWYSWPAATPARQAEMNEVFHLWAAMLLLGLVGLAAPAATAGGICQDKARGSLALLFATDLSDSEIVLGKLAARLVPVLGMILSVAPVLAISTLFGGVAPVSLVEALLVVLSCAVFGCSLALTLSVWGRKTHEVLMATYVLGLLYLLGAPVYAGLQATLPAAWRAPWLPSIWDVLRYNPIFLVLAAFGGSPPVPVTFGTYATFLGMGLAASAALIGAAAWRVRAVVIRQLGRGERAAWSLGRVDLDRLGRWAPGTVRLGLLVRRVWPGPSLDRNPVLWRECRRRRPSRWSLAVWGIYVLLCGGFGLYAIVGMIGGNRWGRELGAVVNGLQVGAGLLLLSVSAATSLAEERQRGSLDVLMTTPLSTRAIVWGKWWGAFRAVPPLLVPPLVLATVLSSHTGRYWGVALMAALILAYGAAITSLGLALATWIPRMHHAVALTVGLYTSMSIAWIPLSLILFGEGPDDPGHGVAAGSPPMGVGAFSSVLAGKGAPREFATQTLWTLFWTIAYGGVALALLLATLLTFNRCLGRIDGPSTRDEDDFARDGETAGPAEVGPSPSCGPSSVDKATAADPLASEP